MNANSVMSYEKSLELFKQNQSTLPQKIRWKLDYISKIISSQQTQKTENMSEEKQLQIQDLKDVNEKGLKIIFTSIVQTLFSSQIPIDKQCLIKKKGFFKSWYEGFIKYDDTYIYFNAANKTSRYRFKNVDISLNASSKRAFDFFYKNTELMTIKFQKPQSMQTMYKTIKNMILKEKNRYDQQMIHKLNSVSKAKPKKTSIVEPSNQDNNLLRQKASQKKSPKYEVVKQQQRANMIGNREKKVMEFQKSFVSEQQNAIIIRNSINSSQVTKQLKLSPVQENYQIKQSTKNMCVALHSTQIKLSLEIILKVFGQMPLIEIFSCLCLYKNWNSKVQKQEICYQMKYQQKVIIYRVYQKSHSLLSKPRQTYTMLEFKKINNNSAILVQQSLENQDRSEQYTRAYLKTIFFVQVHEQNIKICIESQFDPKGYCSFSQSQTLLLNIYKDIVHFQNYLSQRNIKKQSSNESLLFQEIQYQSTSSVETVDIPSDLKKNSIKDQEDREFEHDKSFDEEEQQHEKRALSIYRRSANKNPFFQLKPDSPNKVPTLQYLEFIRKRQFERYYLKHKFQFRVIKKYQDYIPWYCLQQMLKKGGEYEVTQKLQLRFINQQLIQGQKDILRFLLKQIGANLISGKSVLNVSLPVDIFEGRTLLQRSASSFGKCPDYLLRSSQAQPLEQIMNVTAFIASVPTLELIMQKPFNPILGQTFQCYLKGIPLCYQQISHHPPISSYYMECAEFKLYGNLIAFADVGLNSGVGGNIGVMHIIFKNGYHYECHFPPSEISGLIYGDRKFRSYSRGYIIERSQNLFAQFSIEKFKKGIYESKQKLLPGSIIGGIFKVNRKFFDLLNSYNNNLKKFPGVSKEHIIQKLVHINGIWFDKIYMDQRLITQGIRAYPVQYYPYSLPSDANFRLDVLYHKQNNLSESQKEKEVLQNIQREDRKMRQKYEKANKRAR